jgi:hypothetical protein
MLDSVYTIQVMSKKASLIWKNDVKMIEEAKMSARDEDKTKKFCQHCGTLTVFIYSNEKRSYYCTVCGSKFE